VCQHDELSSGVLTRVGINGLVLTHTESADVYWDILTSIDMYWDMLMSVDMYWGTLMYIDIYWHVLRYAYACWHLLKYADVYWHLLTCTEVCLCLLTSVDIYWGTLMCIDIYWHLLKYDDVYWHMLKCIEVHCHVLACTDICWGVLTLPQLSLVNSSSYGTFSANPNTIWCTAMPSALYVGWPSSLRINWKFSLKKLFIASAVTDRQTDRHISVSSIWQMSFDISRRVFHVNTTNELTRSGSRNCNIGQRAYSVWLILWPEVAATTVTLDSEPKVCGWYYYLCQQLQCVADIITFVSSYSVWLILLPLSAATVMNVQIVYRLLHADTTPCSYVALQRCWRLRRHGQAAQTECGLLHPEHRSTTDHRNAGSCSPRPVHSELPCKTWSLFM